ncbi:hypothetical protein DV738_g3563, partial [Chaetothyriales sp. CBS 135597]
MILDIDPVVSTADREQADALIARELRKINQEPLHPSVQPLPGTKASELISKEIDRASAGQPREGGIELSRYEAPDEPGLDDDTQTWHKALRTASISSAYLAGRSINMSLLEELGKNTWLISNSQLDEILKSLNKESELLKQETEMINRERQAMQDGAKAEISALEDTWKRAVGQLIEPFDNGFMILQTMVVYRMPNIDAGANGPQTVVQLRWIREWIVPNQAVSYARRGANVIWNLYRKDAPRWLMGQKSLNNRDTLWLWKPLEHCIAEEQINWGFIYFISHPSFYPLFRARLLPILLISIFVYTLLFTFAFLPQVAFLAIFHNGGAWINATILVLGEGAAIVAILFEGFFVDETLVDVFDAVLINEGLGDLVSRGRQLDPTAEDAVKSLGKPTISSVYAPFSLRQIVEFVILLPLNLVPFVGVPLFLFLTGYRAGPFHHWRYFKLHGFSKKERSEYIRQRQLKYTWFGTVAMVLQLVPGLSMFFLLTTAAGSALWATRMERAKRIRDAVMERSDLESYQDHTAA